MANFLIRAIQKRDKTEDFDCGHQALNAFLKKTASQYHKKGYARIRVMVDKNDTVFAYNTLSSAQIVSAELSNVVVRQLPRHPMPVLLIGRLAVCRSQQGKGFGEEMLMDALKRSVETADTIGVFGVVVDPISNAAERFYARYGFQVCKNTPKRMFISVKTLKQLF
ncbi:MAG: GNAT family N-acetyltransferase [Zetaproteobacteria bacterium]|nr:GNAT family N-acetyltransferase [Zetaproteobacteria bacterium]